MTFIKLISKVAILRSIPKIIDAIEQLIISKSKEKPPVPIPDKLPPRQPEAPLVVDPDLPSFGRLPTNVLGEVMVPEKKDIGPDPREPVPVIKKKRIPRKSPDFTRISLSDYYCIQRRHAEWKVQNGMTAFGYKQTTQDLTDSLNFESGLNKSRSFYSTIWSDPTHKHILQYTGGINYFPVENQV